MLRDQNLTHSENDWEMRLDLQPHDVQRGDPAELISEWGDTILANAFTFQLPSSGRPVSTMSQIEQSLMSAILLYNLALCHHLMGVESTTFRSKNLIKAQHLYKAAILASEPVMAAKEIWWEDVHHVCDPFVSIGNNLGCVGSALRNDELVRLSMEWNIGVDGTTSTADDEHNVSFSLPLVVSLNHWVWQATLCGPSPAA